MTNQDLNILSYHLKTKIIKIIWLDLDLKLQNSIQKEGKINEY